MPSSPWKVTLSRPCSETTGENGVENSDEGTKVKGAEILRVFVQERGKSWFDRRISRLGGFGDLELVGGLAPKLGEGVLHHHPPPHLEEGSDNGGGVNTHFNNI